MTYHRAQSLLEEWLQAERLARHQTAEAAANECGLSPMAFARRGHCGHGMSQATRSALARYLRTTPEMVTVLAGVPAEHPIKTFHSDRRTHNKRTLLGQRLYLEWLRRGQRINEAAAEMGIATSTLQYAVCRASRQPYHGTLAKVATYLGVDLETVIAWHTTPADPPLPIETWSGWKLHPTVSPRSQHGRRVADCERCIFVAGCREDVASGNFAWCEDIGPADFKATADDSECEAYEYEWVEAT